MKYGLIILLVLATCSASSQKALDTLLMRLQMATGDTFKVNALDSLSQYYFSRNFDSTIFYAKAALELAEKVNYPFGKFSAYRRIYFAETFVGDYATSMDFALKQLRAAEQLKDRRLYQMAQSHNDLGFQNRIAGNYPEAIRQFREAFRLQGLSGEPNEGLYGTANSQIAIMFQVKNMMDSALWYANLGYKLSNQAEEARRPNALALSLAVLGNTHLANKDNQLAEKYFRMGIANAQKHKSLFFEARLYKDFAAFFFQINNLDSCIHYARSCLQICQEHHYLNYAMDASKILSRVYESQNQVDSALRYMKLTIMANDTLFSPQKKQQIQLLTAGENQRQQEMVAAQERYRNQVRTIALLTAMGVFLVIAFILFRNNRLQKRAKSQIEKAYGELKSTQAQLIQSEKMASLGELTAGIAHEIQNPLNFVNNFSEVNAELIDEAELAFDTGRINEAKELLTNLRHNQSKINQHGKRADAIVKGMLQHSRESKGQKEPADINALADEYLRLSYQGLRAKDKAFNATLKTDYDPSIGKINILPQDIGRVLLNLYNNAFYAVSEKKKHQPDGYEPTVSVSTTRVDGMVRIRVKDYGTGIPQKVRDKIFQPFFTTKPAGQGTGLGLSLSYAIVKAHGGEIRVDTNEGEYTEFVIQLPISVSV